MPSAVNNLYEFAEFRLDEQKRVLLRRQDPVPLTRKSFETLLVLVQSGGQVVTKDQLMKAVWPDSFVEESNLTQTIFVLRKALGESRDKHYILTVPGLGYRFAPEVRQVTANGRTAAGSLNASGQPFVRSDGARPLSGRLPVLVGIAVVVAALGAYVQWSRSRARPQPPSGKVMLAVLPFENLTGDAAQDYFSDGLTEELISQLGNLDPHRLGVIARTSVMHYKHNQQSLDRIGRELGVQYVLEGSVRRDSDKLRISAQLVQVKDQTHLWARQYDRQMSGLLAVQGEIAQAVADEIQLTLSDNRRSSPDHELLSPNWFEAYDLYLKGRYHWNKRTRQGFEQAIENFQQALVKYPDYARAYAGLADSYALMSSYGLGPATELMPKARVAALRALELDERLAESHTSLGLIYEKYDWNWKAAEKEFRRAIELDPNYATAHHWYAEYLGYQGRFDEALAESDRARRLDPLSLIIAVDRGEILIFARQYDRAIEQFRAVIAVDPDFPRSGLIIGAYLEKGMLAEALAEAEKRKRRSRPPYPTWILGAEILTLGRMGRLEQARHALQELEEANRKSEIKVDPMCVPAGAELIGKEKVFACLEKLYQEHNGLSDLKVNPGYDSVRRDPRFQDLMQRVGLAQ